MSLEHGLQGDGRHGTWGATHRSCDLCTSSLGHPKCLNRMTPLRSLCLSEAWSPKRVTVGLGVLGWAGPGCSGSLKSLKHNQLGNPISIFFIVTQPQRGRSWTVYCCSELIFVKVINMFFKPPRQAEQAVFISTTGLQGEGQEPLQWPQGPCPAQLLKSPSPPCPVSFTLTSPVQSIPIAAASESSQAPSPLGLPS